MDVSVSASDRFRFDLITARGLFPNSKSTLNMIKMMNKTEHDNQIVFEIFM